MYQTFHRANIDDVCKYYDRTEASFRLFLGGTKHFGWYEPGQCPWRFRRSLRQMECVLSQKLGLPAGCHVLDAGSGIGHVARRMALQYGLIVTGVDVRKSNVAEARQRSEALRIADRTFFLTSDYHSMDIPDATFDGVYTMEALVHSSDVTRALTEFHRVLKPGGRLVMFEYSRTPVADLTPEANRAMINVCTKAAMPAWLSLNHGDLEALMAKVGMDRCETTDATSHMLPMLHAFSLLGIIPYSACRLIGRETHFINAMSGVEMYRHQQTWRYNIYSSNRQL
jgi:ubiquinone/menaquinone biosynthesis C-methylase UbiE